MAEILKGLYEYYTCTLDCSDEAVHADVLGGIEEKERC